MLLHLMFITVLLIEIPKGFVCVCVSSFAILRCLHGICCELFM